MVGPCTEARNPAARAARAFFNAATVLAAAAVLPTAAPSIGALAASSADESTAGCVFACSPVVRRRGGLAASTSRMDGRGVVAMAAPNDAVALAASAEERVGLGKEGADDESGSMRRRVTPVSSIITRAPDTWM